MSAGHRRKLKLTEKHLKEIASPHKTVKKNREADLVEKDVAETARFVLKLGAYFIVDTVRFFFSIFKWGLTVAMFWIVSYIWEGLVIFFFGSLDVINIVINDIDSVISAIASLGCKAEDFGASVVSSISTTFGGSSVSAGSCNTYDNLIENALGGSFQSLLRVPSVCDHLTTWKDVFIALFEGSTYKRLDDIARFLYPARTLYRVYVGSLAPVLPHPYPHTDYPGYESSVCGWLKFYLVLRDFLPPAIIALVVISSYSSCIFLVLGVLWKGVIEFLTLFFRFMRALRRRIHRRPKRHPRRLSTY